MHYRICDEDEQWFITAQLFPRSIAEDILEQLEAGHFPQVHQPGSRVLKIKTVYLESDYPRTNVDARKIP